MAHHAEPMDIDDESDFDNKENTYHHTNVLPRTPCTEKGYEELDVSELNMKLRYSTTPAASPMSKSMSHCLDNRHNTSMDESLNNTVINEYENNLTRSLNSSLNKTEVKSPKSLPLQALPTDAVDSNRSTSVLRPLDSTVTTNDITITVSNENEIDNLSFPSSSSSMAHTPEATTPTKEIPKHDGGSPIMRGLKSVLSMFRSSQSPIPPGEEETRAAEAGLSPNLLPETKPQAIASTPKNENSKERTLSRRNSPLKETIVFNEDLEKELQWNDDSTIVFSTEKIPIHKLFFQEKSSKSTILNENDKCEDANSTVEYMDVSYNDLSIDRTLNGTVNKSKINEMPESDGEFLDCETTFTQNETHSKEELDAVQINNNEIPKASENELVKDNALNNESFKLDTTKDIINLIDSSHPVVERDPGKQLDYSTTDIVNQLSDLINETSETFETNVTSIKNVETVSLNSTERLESTSAKTINIIQQELIQYQETSPVNPVDAENNISVAVADQVCIRNDNLVDTAGVDSNVHLQVVEPKISSAPIDGDILKTPETCPQTQKCIEAETIAAPEDIKDSGAGYPSPVDVPLPNEDDINELNDNLLEDVVYAEVQNKTTLDASSSQNALMAALDKSVTEATNDIQHTQLESQNDVIACLTNLLSSDVPLPNIDENTDKIPHEAMTVVFAPVEPPIIAQPDIIPIDVNTPNVDPVIEIVCKSLIEAVSDVSCVQDELENTKIDILCPPSLAPSDIPLPGVDDSNLITTNNLLQETATVDSGSIQQYSNEMPDVITTGENTSKVHSINDTCIIETVQIVSDVVKIPDVEPVNTIPTDLTKRENEEHMEISFVEPTNDKNNESLTMDVSMVDENKKVEATLDQPQLSETAVIHDVESIPADIVTAKNPSQDEVPLQVIDSIKMVSGNNIGEIINRDIALEPVAVTTMSKDLVMNDTSKLSETLNEDDLKTCGNIEPSLNSNMSDAVSSVLEKSQQPTLPEKENGTDEPQIVDVLKLNDVPDIVSGVNVTPVAVDAVTPSFSEQETNMTHLIEDSNDNRKCDVKEDADVQEMPKSSNTTINPDSADNVDSTPKFDEKIDEEIVLSESNSPFISMSAEEEFNPESKKEEFEEMENPFSTKTKVAQSPPASPIIVSKGYNFNFDDIDNINPFATKTKIRMSPPPSESPNASLATEDVNKTNIVEPLKTDKNINRRKSMPERKKPLKAKRHLNSTFDSTESAPSQTIPCKNSDATITSNLELKQEQSVISDPEINKSDINASTSSTQDINRDKLNVTMPDINEEKAQKEPEAQNDVDKFKEDTSVNDETSAALSNETKVIEDVVMSDSSKSPVKSDTTSSSEQSTYFSAGASSTELTESKNVFNLPELDSFNPFVTKSKIRQTPPKDLDIDNPFATKNKINSSPETSFVVTQNDPNSTVTIDNEKKDAMSDLSHCSGSSKTSDGKDVTVHEVNTEDEDTIEGPFLEAEDGKDCNKMPEFIDDKDMVDLNPQENEEAAEMFIDAEAFEFLMNQNKTDEVAYSGKESLFLKFDPLFARRVTAEGVAAALNEIKRKQSTPKKTAKQGHPKEVDFLSFEKPIAGPSDLNSTHDVQGPIEEKSGDLNVTASKPTMAVTPAVNPVVTPRKSLTPNKTNRLSMTFTSPAMAVIDRLLSLSGNSPSADTTVTRVDRPHSEADQALTQLRELLAEKEINVYNLRCESKELKDRLTTLESQMKALEAESEERLKKVNELNENLAEKTKMNRNMGAVVEEYERTIASLISETEQDKKRFAEERNQLIRDRDEQTAHLASMEISFNDLHSKYEKSKQVIMGYKINEEAYKKSIQEFEDNLAKMHTNYELLKQHATSKLNHANQELEKINKAHEAEVLKFNAMIKRKELHITSLEESLTQKTKANEELTAICDELINKVG